MDFRVNLYSPQRPWIYFYHIHLENTGRYLNLFCRSSQLNHCQIFSCRLGKVHLKIFRQGLHSYYECSHFRHYGHVTGVFVVSILLQALQPYMLLILVLELALKMVHLWTVCNAHPKRLQKDALVAPVQTLLFSCIMWALSIHSLVSIDWVVPYFF